MGSAVRLRGAALCLREGSALSRAFLSDVYGEKTDFGRSSRFLYAHAVPMACKTPVLWHRSGFEGFSRVQS